LTYDIVGLALARLRRLDCSGLVEVPLVVNIEFPKGIRQPKDFVLLKLREFPKLL